MEWSVTNTYYISLNSKHQVSAKSVKLLDEQELKDSDAREAWWVEIRQEVPSLLFLCMLLPKLLVRFALMPRPLGATW